MRYLIGVDIGTSGTKTVLFDENGTLEFSERYTLEENGNYRTEVYKPTYKGDDIYLYMVIVQESEDWMSDRIEEIKYFEDGSIEYHKQK